MKPHSSCWFTHSKETSPSNLKAVRQKLIIPSVRSHFSVFFVVFRDTSPHAMKCFFSSCMNIQISTLPVDTHTYTHTSTCEHDREPYKWKARVCFTSNTNLFLCQQYLHFSSVNVNLLTNKLILNSSSSFTSCSEHAESFQPLHALSRWNSGHSTDSI